MSEQKGNVILTDGTSSEWPQEVKREFILLVAGDFVHGRQVFSGFAHQEFGEWAKESIPVHAIDEMVIPHPQAPSCLFNHIRHATHGFRSAGGDDIGIPQHNLLIAQDDCFQP